MNILNRLIVAMLPLMPKSLVWLFSKRYIAGKSLEAGADKARELNGEGCRATMDVLGEEIMTLDEAEEEKAECLRVLEIIHRRKLDANLSIKLTSLGLRIDKAVCLKHVFSIVEKAELLNNRVRIDMEDSTCTDDTLDIYRQVRKKYDNVGTVIQSYLKRSVDDVRGLIDDGIADFRICKGIYIEPVEIAYKDRQQIRDSFMEIVEMMLDSGSYAAIATHDKQLIQRSLDAVHSEKIQKDKYEFQMLLGVTEKMRAGLVAAGHRMRIYVPYGEHWYGYSSRRLKENPNIAWHVIKNIFVRR